LKTDDTETLNILYIVVDQQRFDMLGAYGNSIVSTPNIDALAADGLLMKYAFTPCALCGPARTSLFTGSFPTSHGVVRNAEENIKYLPAADPHDNLPVISDRLENYRKIYLGKWHVSETKLPKDYGFEGHNYDGYGFPGSRLYKNLVFNQAPLTGNPYREWLTGNGFEIPSVEHPFFGNNPHLRKQELYGKLTGPEEASIPHYLADEAVRYLDLYGEDEQPFFMWLNFWGPHTPCVIPEPYYSMYDPASIPEDPAFLEDFKYKPVHHKHVSQMWGVYDLPWSQWAEIVARYYGYITLIDTAVGKVISHLKEKGLYDSTYIVFTSDHGDAMGSNKLIEKGEFMYDTSYRIPMIIRDPAEGSTRGVSTEFANLQDLFMTAADIAGQSSGDTYESRSLLPLTRDEPLSSSRDYVFAQFFAHFTDYQQRMIRNHRYKFIFNTGGLGELYDLKHDPSELQNLIHDPDYSEVKRGLIADMLNEMEVLGDPQREWLMRIQDVY